MAAQHYYSHKELDGVSSSEKQELLFQKGVNWNDYPDFFKRGTFIQRRKKFITLTDEELARIPEKHRPARDQKVERTQVIVIPMPPFGKVSNREGVIFDGEDPIVIKFNDVPSPLMDVS